MENQNSMGRFQALCKIFPESLRIPLLALDDATQGAAQEIRLRAGKPVQICSGAESLFLTAKGQAGKDAADTALTATADEIFEVFRAVCGYSVHSHQGEIAQGFVAFQGGHRVGLCGTAVTADGAVTGMRDVSSLNIRIAKQIYGCADDVLACAGWGSKGVLLAGAPGSGKTTILRDMARQLASGEQAKKVALIDERGELAASWQGVPQNDVGSCTDVLSGYSKREGILMAVRALSPDIIICDEIGREADIDALKTGATCGVKLAASVHASTMEEVLRKPFVRELAALGAFGVVVLLEGKNKVGAVKQVLWLEEHNHEDSGMSAGNCMHHAGGDSDVVPPLQAGDRA